MNAADIEYIFDRLDMDHVRACAQQARDAWDGEQPVFEVCLQPGDGTHYGLLFTILRPDTQVFGAPGGGSAGMTPYTVTGCSFDGRYAAVTYLQRERTGFVRRDNFVDPGWVETSYGAGPASGLALAVFLNEVTQASPGWRERMLGNYREAEAEEDE